MCTKHGDIHTCNIFEAKKKKCTTIWNLGRCSIFYGINLLSSRFLQDILISEGSGSVDPLGINRYKSKSISHTPRVLIFKTLTSWRNFHHRQFTTKGTRVTAETFQVHGLDFWSCFQMCPVFTNFNHFHLVFWKYISHCALRPHIFHQSRRGRMMYVY